ncbi:MAG TPA: FAD-dependent oxidoreductase [Acidimicrobiales bacterium]|nr:FAD-dependent oxidoreductase [Acidimicrobiales bacterium]
MPTLPVATEAAWRDQWSSTVPERFDAVVVGAGPAGSMAALALARAGRSVCLIERGPYPGAKNLFGGVVYGRLLDGVLPGWAGAAPIERFVTRRVTMVLTEQQSLAVDFRSSAWGEPPYNGATVLRPVFDSWLASQAEAAGATLVCSTTATGLLRSASGRIEGVRTDRPNGDVVAGVVIACDGVNAFLAREAGLAGEPEPANYTLGVKEVLALGAGEIERRFSLGEGEGADFEVLGATGGVAGGGFLYTNRETVSVGLVLALPDLPGSGERPEELLASFKAHPSIAPLVAGGEVVEYGAHLIPEAGLAMVPTLAGDGILVAGDAAGLCLAAGIWLEGVNFAMASGLAAGEAAAEALAAGDVSAAGLAGYRRRLEGSFVLADHRRLAKAPHLVLSDRVQQRYPAFVCNVVEEMFTVRNPSPKPGATGVARRELRKAGLRVRDLIRDGWTAWRTFG